MKNTTKIFSSVLAIGLIMTLSPAQSMEMTTSYELPESGIMIHFTPPTERSDTLSHPAGVPEKTPEMNPPADATARIELPESGQMILFSTEDEPRGPESDSIRYITKPYVETPAPLAGASYHKRHTFEMPESGQKIVFYETLDAPPAIVGHDTRADKSLPR